MSFPHGRTGSTLTVDERPLGVATEEAESSLSEYRHQTIVVERRRVISGGNKKVGNRITTEREAKVVSTRFGLIHLILYLIRRQINKKIISQGNC